MDALTAPADRIAAIRRFNRFYTRRLGVLRKTYLDSPFSLGEARVLYEIARGDRPTASDIARRLDLDAGYLSRVLRQFEKRGLVSRKTSKQDARQSHLALTARGKRTFTPLDRRSQEDVGAALQRLSEPEQVRLVAAMETIEALLAPPAAAAREADDIVLRAPRCGEYGWIVARHGDIYANEYGWGEPFEGLCAQIVADFANRHDARRERCWIAEMAGAPAGSVMLVKDTDEVARIRLLIVDPRARGHGVGKRLVEECITFARSAGYARITLWTHSVLTAARHIYKSAGFTLTRSEEHDSWGKPVVGEHWDLTLRG